MSDPVTEQGTRVPILAVVGRPNVGKSTLVNRILGRREAVVEDVPGVTRDRVSYDAVWNGRAFTVVDTGGWDPDARGLAERIAAQAEIAVDVADAVLFVVDATVGITDADEAVVRILRQVRQARRARRQQGRRPARRGRGRRAVEPRARRAAARSRRCTAAAPATCSTRSSRRCPRRRRRPSTRSADRAGSRSSAAPTSASPRCSTSWPRRTGSSSTTRPARRSTRSTSWSSSAARPGGSSTPPASASGSKTASGHEYYASPAHRDRDRARRGVRAGHRRRRSRSPSRTCASSQTVRDSGRALVIAFNKWDLVDEERRYYLDREIERDLVQVQWAPRINITARTGWHVDRLVPALEKALAGWETRVSTGPAERLPRPAGRRAPAPGARRASSRRSCSAPSRRPRRRRSCCSPPASWTPATCASSSVGCARSSASSARRSTSQQRPREKRKR